MDAEVFKFLAQQVEETRTVYEVAKQRFWEIAGKPREWPTTDLPYPDGSDLFRRVVAHEKFAMKVHVEAMMRLNRFLLDGTVPDDVREKLGRAKGTAAGSGQ
jgi:hypothetical protein